MTTMAGHGSLDGLETVRLRSEASGLAATFAPGAGMVGTSLRDDDAELLGQRGGLESYARAGKTMGIPLLHPWANRLAGNEYRVGGDRVRLPADAPFVHRDPNGLPIHGLLAGSPYWRIDRSGHEPDGGGALVASLDFAAHNELLECFPFPHRLRMEATLAESTLRIQVTLTATGDRPVPVSFGFHPYLRMPSPDREDWRIDLPAMSQLRTDGLGIPTGTTEHSPATSRVLGSASIDEGFVDVAEGAELSVAGPERRITVRFERGFPAAQVYAPLDDDVICFEPMTAPTNALCSGDRLELVDPGDSYEAAFSITVTSI
jgi:galactose mutarotase-like enzyme